MSRRGWTALVVATALVAGNWDGNLSKHVPDAGPLQGVWVITSVHKNGFPGQVNGIITFRGDTVQFEGVIVAYEAANIPDGSR